MTPVGLIPNDFNFGQGEKLRVIRDRTIDDRCVPIPIPGVIPVQSQFGLSLKKSLDFDLIDIACTV